MASLIPSRAPNLPLATVQYEARYQDQFANVLRLYFNTIDNALGEIIRILDYTGPFDTLYANTVQATNVNATNVNTTNLASLFATIQQLQATTIAAANIQGGNGVFNNLTGSNVNASLFTGSGRRINLPHIGASGNADQYAGGDNVPTIVSWDTADELNGFTLNIDNTATAIYSGVYKINYGLQFANTSNAAHDVIIWIKVNGSDVAKSAVKFTLPARKSAGVPSYLLTFSSIVFNIQAGQSIGLWWATDKAYNPVGPVDGVYIEYLPAQTTPYAHPAVPASIGSITYVSAPDPALTLVTPIGVSGYGRIGAPTIVIT